jgi:hypothetical protein
MNQTVLFAPDCMDANDAIAKLDIANGGQRGVVGEFAL